MGCVTEYDQWPRNFAIARSLLLLHHDQREVSALPSTAERWSHAPAFRDLPRECVCWIAVLLSGIWRVLALRPAPIERLHHPRRVEGDAMSDRLF